MKSNHPLYPITRPFISHFFHHPRYRGLWEFVGRAGEPSLWACVVAGPNGYGLEHVEADSFVALKWEPLLLMRGFCSEGEAALAYDLARLWLRLHAPGGAHPLPWWGEGGRVSGQGAAPAAGGLCRTRRARQRALLVQLVRSLGDMLEPCRSPLCCP
jgi:hypothetical protein